jgi:hypothetical protein
MKLISISSLIPVGFEIEGHEFLSIFSMTAAEAASRAFIQFDDISTKFSSTARAFGSMDLANIGNIELANATITFAFGLGILEISDKIYFNKIASAIQALIQNVQWQQVGMMDITLPVIATIDIGNLDLALNPIISITSPDLFSPEYPSMSLDLNLE